MAGFKRNWLKSIAAKRLPINTGARGAKKIFQYGLKQMKHPAVGQYLRDVAGIAAMSGGNLEAAGPMIAGRSIEEAGNIALRTAKHNGLL